MKAKVKMAVKVLHRLFIPSSHPGYDSTADKLPLCDSYGLNYWTFYARYSKAAAKQHCPFLFLLEKLIDSDEEIGTLYLEEKEISPIEIKAALRWATIKNKIIPVCGGSAFKNKGVQATLDAVIDYYATGTGTE